jgi:hypothetical protein
MKEQGKGKGRKTEEKGKKKKRKREEKGKKREEKGKKREKKENTKINTLCIKSYLFPKESWKTATVP